MQLHSTIIDDISELCSAKPAPCRLAWKRLVDILLFKADDARANTCVG